MSRLAIAVIGQSKATPKLKAIAAAAGREIARRGAVLVCGGLGGVMEAACGGAKAEGGLTVGIIPGEDPKSANRHVDIVIPTGIGYARNVLVATAGHGVIAIGGSVGTLSEIAFALTRKLPVAAIGSWKLERERMPEGAIFLEAADAKEAADFVFRHISGGSV